MGELEAWTAWRNGDGAAGQALVEQHFLAVYRFFSTKLPDEADDLSQATFAACVEGRASFRGDASFRSFVLGVARKQLLRHLEGRGLLMGGRAVSEVSIADLVPSPSSAVAHAERRALLIDAMRTIPLDFQMVLELHYWEGLPTQAVAEVLEVAQGTVKSRLSRAREQLKSALERQQASSGVPLEDELRAAFRD
ncbi:MAG: sigma-70 family RNA polymerase sigma factor [Myxococcota bacterium]